MFWPFVGPFAQEFLPFDNFDSGSPAQKSKQEAMKLQWSMWMVTLYMHFLDLKTFNINIPRILIVLKKVCVVNLIDG